MADTRTIILVHSTPQNRDGGDPAIDLDAPGIGGLLTAYQRTRSDEDRAAIPLRHGMRPAEFVVQRLPIASLRVVLDAKGATEEAVLAVLAGCHQYTDASGTTHTPRLTKVKGTAWAADEWAAQIADEYGEVAIEEIGHAIIQWSRAPRSALTPFAWVPGLVLAR